MFPMIKKEESFISDSTGLKKTNGSFKNVFVNKISSLMKLSDKKTSFTHKE